MSPPIVTTVGAFKARTAYNISKMGMTMVALGVCAENRKENIIGASLWPATVIESQASINFDLGDTSLWRKACILADCVVGIVMEGDDYRGHMLIDDEYLRVRQGFGDEELVQYRYNPDVEPPRLLAEEADSSSVKRGSVTRLESDKQRSDKVWKGGSKL